MRLNTSFGDNKEYITLKGVNKSFPVRDNIVKVLKGVDLVLPQNKFIVVFGPSGSGKSTLLNILLGLEKPDNGEINIGGFRLDREDSEVTTSFRKEKVGVITQQPNWIKSANVLNNVAFPLLLHGVPSYKAYTRAMELISLMGMKPWVNFYPTELSYGQQQKIAVARALVTDPEIIVADEPTGNLDYESGLNLVNILSELCKNGRTVLMVTHDLNNIELSDIIVRVFDGKVVERLITKDHNLRDLKKYLIDYSKFVESGTRAVNKLEVIPIDPLDVKKTYNNVFDRIKDIFRNTVDAFSTTFFVLISLIFKGVYMLLSFKFLPTPFKNSRFIIEALYDKFISITRITKPNSIKPSQLLDIAIRSLFFRKTRAIITIGGVSIGIAFTVFLLSIGFGIERLVISRVASLSVLNQLDIYPSSGRQLKIDNSSIEEFVKFDNVTEALPVLNMAGRIEYQESNLDAVVFSVQSKYLEYSDFSLLDGEYFQNNELPENNTSLEVQELNEESSSVAGESTNVLSQNSVGDLETIEVDIKDNSLKEAVVNISLLRNIGLSSSDAIGKEIDLSFLLTNESNKNDLEVQSKPDKYVIVGVIGNQDTPVVYIPLKTVESFGDISYTQARIVTTDQTKVDPVRDSFEILGYRTSSVLDTITQIEQLFNTARTVFLAVGIVALSVASLGMFNTLTVSLLERTKEVGIMKVIGLSSRETKQLFLSESILISLFGTIVGILFGIFGGFLFSVLVSIISLSRANLFVNISFLPLETAGIILLIALFIGLVTGYYPAFRATRISPLEALRYE